jgi:hypothetical protein
MHVYIMLKKYLENVKIIFIRTKNNTKNFGRMKIFQFYIYGLKLKFAIFLETKNLFNHIF